MLMPPALYSSDKKAAEEYLKTTKYPFVSKAIEGAHASNVRLVENEDQARKELEAIFSEEGKARHDAHIPGLTQKGYVLWQKFMPNNRQMIGDLSYWEENMGWLFIGKIGTTSHLPQVVELRTPENELTPQIISMLDWARKFVLDHKISVLAADVILDENEDFVLVETSTTWPTIMHEKNVVFKYENDKWITSKFKELNSLN